MELSVIRKLKKVSFYQGENTKHGNVHILVGSRLFERKIFDSVVHSFTTL